MIELLKLNRLQLLKKQYRLIKTEAKRLMSNGDISNYLNKLTEANKVLVEYNYTLTIEAR